MCNPSGEKLFFIVSKCILESTHNRFVALSTPLDTGWKQKSLAAYQQHIIHTELSKLETNKIENQKQRERRTQYIRGVYLGINDIAVEASRRHPADSAWLHNIVIEEEIPNCVSPTCASTSVLGA